MSKFQSTVSTVAALASICGATAAGWKLADMSSSPSTTHLERKIQLLEERLNDSIVERPVQEVQLKITPEVKEKETIVSVQPIAPLPPIQPDVVPVDEVAQ